MMGMSASAEMAVGMPMTMPEKVASPPRCLAYSLDDETTMKNETWLEVRSACSW
jgi:hypothetical protein